MLPVTPDDVEVRVSWLGVTGGQLADGDTGNALYLRGRRTGRDLQGLTRAQIRSLHELWAGLATIVISLDDLKKVELHEPRAGEKIDQLATDLDYECTVEVSSAALAQAGFPTDRVQWFATQRGLIRNATLPAEALSHGEAATRFVVGDGHIDLSGPHLSVISVAEITEDGDGWVRPKEAAPGLVPEAGPPAMVIGQHVPMHPARFELNGDVGWDQPAVVFLVDSALRSALCHWGTYTQATEEGVLETVLLRAGGSPPVHITHGGVVDGWDTAKTSAAISDLSRWVYLEAPGATRRWTRERLGLLREALARIAADVPAARRYAVLRETLGSVLAQAESTWTAFVSGALDEHSAAVDALDGALATASSEFARTSGDIASRVVSTMLSTAAVVIGVFVAGALEVELSEAALDAALVTYAGYLVLFPGLLGLLNSLVDYRATGLRLSTSTTRAAAVLGPGAVTENGRAPTLIRSGRRRFWVTLIVAVLVYVVAAGALVFVAVDLIPLPAPADGPGSP